jgi:hypothetical protein
MSSITTWNRLEPSPRAPSLAAGLEARIADPLWLLARQWQLGELTGQDSGSPVELRSVATAAPLARLRGRDGTTAALDVAAAPLEALVEQEDPPLTDRLALDAGLHFLRLLEREGVEVRARDVARAFALALAPDAPAFVRALAALAPDGRLLDAALEASLDDVAQRLGIAGADRPGFERAAAAFRAWLAALAPRRPAGIDTWDPQRLEHRFGVEADLPGEAIRLEADEYPGGHLDWFAFRQSERVPAPAGAQPARTTVRAVIPTPVSFPGMPRSRFWEIEPRTVDLGAVDTSADDLIAMLLVEFSVGYGDDWFLAPVDAPVGHAIAIDSLVVRDSFGVRTRIRSSREVDGPGSPWRMFDLGAERPEEDVLLLPPSIAVRVEGAPIESVAFARDEMANMAWGIEERVDRGDGAPSERAGELPLGDRRRHELAAASEAELWWRLMTDVPTSWFPLVPTGREGERPTGLEMRHFRGDDGKLVDPLGRILPELDDVMLFGEEIPRAGVTVDRSTQRARWLLGRTALWTGRRARPGRGELRSGLRFDASDPAG